MNIITVFIPKKDFKTTDYFDNTGCALSKNLIKNGHKLGNSQWAGVGGNTAAVDGEDWFILEWEEIIEYYKSPKDLLVHLLKI